MARLQRIATGIGGLDELLGGGLPMGKCILVVGSPGSGKTTLAMQYLCHGAATGQRGLYIALDEKPERVKENLHSFGWGLDNLEKEGKLLIVDATPIRRVRRVGAIGYEHEEEAAIIVSVPELTLKSLVKTVRKIVEEEDVQRIGVDPITSLVLRYDEVAKRRRALLIFFDMLMDTGCTSLVTTELRTGILTRRFQLEEFLSQGVILLHTLVHDGNVIRAIQVEKMRGIEHDTQLRPYQITGRGIEVFAKDRVFG